METERELRRRDAQEQLAHNRYIRRREKAAAIKKAKQSVSWLVEFSKKVVVMCVVLHAAAFLYAAVVMWQTGDISALPVIISESSDVMKSCVFGYFIKSGVENWVKLPFFFGKKKNDAQMTEGKEESEG